LSIPKKTENCKEPPPLLILIERWWTYYASGSILKLIVRTLFMKEPVKSFPGMFRKMKISLYDT